MVAERYLDRSRMQADHTVPAVGNEDDRQGMVAERCGD